MRIAKGIPSISYLEACKETEDKIYYVAPQGEDLSSVLRVEYRTKQKASKQNIGFLWDSLG